MRQNVRCLHVVIAVVVVLVLAVCWGSGAISNERGIPSTLSEGPGPIPLLGYRESSSGLNNPQMEGGPTDIKGADIDMDGDIDLLSIGDHGSPYINTQEHGVMVWFNDGNAKWTVYQNGEFGYGGISVGDVNNDGKWDIGYGMHHNYAKTDWGDQVLEVAL